MNKTFGYARVSTKEQHLDRQIQALREAGVEERDIITDKASGASLDRPGYQTLKNSMLREGDTLVIKSLDRLSRNKEHITQELRYFKEHHIQVRVLDLPTTTLSRGWPSPGRSRVDRFLPFGGGFSVVDRRHRDINIPVDQHRSETILHCQFSKLLSSKRKS